MDNQWNEWKRPPHHNVRVDRTPLLCHVRFIRSTTASPLVNLGTPTHDGVAINIGTGGLCVLTEAELSTGDVLRLAIPLPAQQAHTPTLGLVRWLKRLSFTRSQVSCVGVQFML